MAEKFVRKLYVGASVLVVLLAAGWWAFWPRPVARPDYRPRVAALRADNFFVYPPHGTLRGTVIFFGNDVGFWQPHQELSDFLSRQGYGVVGMDLRRLLKSQARLTAAQRDTVVGSALRTSMLESLAEFHGERLPLILMGHSLGAEIAIWAGAHLSTPRISGIVAMAPGGRGHLALTTSDYLSSALPTGPDSYSMADLVKSSRPDLRIALVRGANDSYRGSDPDIVAAGGPRLKKFDIPLAGHSLKKILIAQYVVRDAISWVETSSPPRLAGSN